jgi:hypothetical protein
MKAVSAFTEEETTKSDQYACRLPSFSEVPDQPAKTALSGVLGLRIPLPVLDFCQGTSRSVTRTFHPGNESAWRP